MGIEPTFEAWEAPVLPLNYTRKVRGFHHSTVGRLVESPPDGSGKVSATVSMRINATFGFVPGIDDSPGYGVSVHTVRLPGSLPYRAGYHAMQLRLASSR